MGYTRICKSHWRQSEHDYIHGPAAMTPTAKQQWLDLPYETGIYAKHPSAIEVRDGRVRVLQQWWEGPPTLVGFNQMTVAQEGEWRDIPIAREE